MAFISAILIVGLLLRLSWLARNESGLTGFAGAGEATRVALALAHEGQFADAFGAGSGPTAHVMPALPIVAGAVFRAFPAEGPIASLLLLVWSLGQSFIGYLLLHRLFAQLGTPRAGLRWAIIMLAVLPVFASDETIAFRYWEGAAAVCLATLGLTLAIGVEQTGTLRTGKAIAAALLWATTAFVNPIAGLALAAVWAYVSLRRLRIRDAVRFALLSAFALAAVLVPWTIRNAEALGSAVPLRSNFGLEFAIGNHPAALAEGAPERIYAERLSSIHPLHGAAARAAMERSGGEVQYNRLLRSSTVDWIIKHPTLFARLTLRHLRQFLFPDPWQMMFSGWEELLLPRALLVSIVSLTGVFAVTAGVIARRPGYMLLAIYIGMVCVPYALVQPIPRYTYLLWGLLAFAALDGIFRLSAARPSFARNVRYWA